MNGAAGPLRAVSQPSHRIGIHDPCSGTEEHTESASRSQDTAKKACGQGNSQKGVAHSLGAGGCHSSRRSVIKNICTYSVPRTSAFLQASVRSIGDISIRQEIRSPRSSNLKLKGRCGGPFRASTQPTKCNPMCVDQTSPPHTSLPLELACVQYVPPCPKSWHDFYGSQERRT